MRNLPKLRFFYVKRFIDTPFCIILSYSIFRLPSKAKKGKKFRNVIFLNVILPNIFAKVGELCEKIVYLCVQR